jgi:hypothetical protein
MNVRPMLVFSFLVLTSTTLWAANGADVSRPDSVVPASLNPGQIFRVRIRAYNTGTTTWTALGNYRLGAAASNNVTWSNWGCGGYSLATNNARAYLCGNVAPGGFQDFNFDITAPGSGPATFSAQMVQDGVQWFGDLETWSITINGAVNNADVVQGSSSVPGSMTLSQRVRVTIQVTNIGSSTWTATNLYRLAATANNRVSWSNFGCGGYANSVTDARAYLCANVGPGQSHNFQFDITAPASGTSTTLAVRMVRDGVEFFGETAQWAITLSGGGGGLPFVQASGAGFICNGAAYRVVGANLRGTAYRGVGEIDEQLRSLQSMNGRVVRVFIVRNDRDINQTKQAVYDLINTARSINPRIRFILSLTDFYGAGTGYYAPGDGGFFNNGLLTNFHGWYGSGFRTNYKPFVGALVTEFKNAPEIFAWELGNELSVGTDNAADSNTMLTFAYEMGNYIRGLGAQQMITTGFISSHHAAAGKYNGRTLAQLAAAFYASWNGQTSPFNFMSIHGYNNEWAVGGGNSTIDDWSWAQNTKPYVVGEIGFGGGGGAEPFGGGSWDGIAIPATGGVSRGPAVRASVDHFFDVRGADAVLQWGFMTGTDNGEGDAKFGLDTVLHFDWNDVFGYYQAKGAALPGNGC